jgi:hypothetical protein
MHILASTDRGCVFWLEDLEFTIAHNEELEHSTDYAYGIDTIFVFINCISVIVMRDRQQDLFKAT